MTIIDILNKYTDDELLDILHMRNKYVYLKEIIGRGYMSSSSTDSVLNELMLLLTYFKKFMHKLGYCGFPVGKTEYYPDFITWLRDL